MRNKQKQNAAEHNTTRLEESKNKSTRKKQQEHQNDNNSRERERERERAPTNRHKFIDPDFTLIFSIVQQRRVDPACLLYVTHPHP